MKFIYQFGIIAGVTLLGELLRVFIDIPIPASVWGLVLMLLLLITKVVKVDDVKETGDFLIQIMPIMFVPATVGLINTWPRLQNILLPVILIVIVTTVVVMVVSGLATQWMINRRGDFRE